MSKHKKSKHQQKNLSLKERLGKHWDNYNWDIFVSLFLRDRDASLRTPWANLLNDALYNSLTKALFVDKNLNGAENTLALIYAERDTFGIPASLADCAGVTSDFLKARRNIFLKELSPLESEPDLPAAYLSLRKGLSSLVASSISSTKKRKTQKDGAAALVEKFATQFSNLERAKTSARYTTWLKTAEQLESLSKGTGNESTFRAIHAIAALVRELFRTGKGENLLRDPEYLLESKLLSAVPPGQTHPAVRALWEFFCRAGERKYGAEWGEAARVFQLSFIAEESQGTLRTQYQRLMKAEPDSTDVLISKIIRGSSTWTDQELYILNTIFVANFEIHDELDISFDMQFLGTFNLFTRIGRRWRPEAPWSTSIQLSFDKLLRECPFSVITSVITNIPYDAVSQYALVMLPLLDAGHLKAIEKAASNRLPLRLAERDIEELEDYTIENPLPRWTMQVLETLVDRAGVVSILTRLAYGVLGDSAAGASMGAPPSQQPWTKFSRGGFLEELAIALPPDNFVGCFCRLCSGKSPWRISSDPSKIEAFFTALPQGTTERVDYFLPFLLTWPDVGPEFLVRLFEKTYHLFSGENERTFYEIWFDLEDLADLVERMPNKADRETVALGMLALLKRDGRKKRDASFKKAVQILERVGHVKNVIISKEAESVFDKAKKIVQKITGQGRLPFED